jgi:hypothetical protein
VDRSKRLASPFGGPAFLRQYYRGVQLGSLSWVIAKIDPAAPETAEWSAVFTKPATVVISGSLLSPLYLHVSAVHLRAEAFTGSGDEAAVLADKLTAFIALTRSAEISVGTHGTDADVKALFDSVKVRQDGDHAVVTAAMPLGFLHKMLTGPPPEPNEPATVPAQSPALPNPSR